MKRVISGKLYDTETAEMIAQWTNGEPRGDFSFIDECLYKTKKGAYFLHGVGGALTRYSHVYGGDRTGGERIIPFMCETAAEWCAEHDLVDVLEKEFPDSYEEA